MMSDGPFLRRERMEALYRLGGWHENRINHHVFLADGGSRHVIGGKEERDGFVIRSPVKEVRWDPDTVFPERRPAHSSPDDCVYCGACAGSCPTGAITIGGSSESFDLDEDTCVDCGACYHNCPAEHVYWDKIRDRMFETGKVDSGPLGPVREIRVGRAIDTHVMSAGQHGGVATALLLSFIRSGEAHAAIVTTRERNWITYPIISGSAEEIIDSAGVKSTIVPRVIHAQVRHR